MEWYKYGEYIDPSAYYGKTISSIVKDGESILITFIDGPRIEIFDHGQSCCEHRYMTVEDDLDYLVGSKLLGIELKDGGDMPSDESHQVMLS